jgi:hypothetical protein
MNSGQIQKNFRGKPVLIAVLACSVAIIVLWFATLGDSNHLAALMGAGYALLCTGFLIFQIVAFILAHTDYDQSVEQAKFDPILVERREWNNS